MVRRAVPFALIRVFLLSVVAVVGSAYALVRYYTRPHPPMVVPSPSATVPTQADPSDGGEIPAPELIPYEEPQKQ
ncbi:hypothetical protein LZC95_45910 [Pendulispora brunnea]|uniref:Uncharacterized protein n=1 Tax=Pendulispora brunnea TaxID=2905690 RepID=A0ABZ2K526_9BACT